MKEILNAIESDNTTAQDFAAIPIPETYRAVVVREQDTEMFVGMATADKDPMKSLHLQEIATPGLEPGEVLVASMASAINYNTVWTAIFEPAPTFQYMQRFAASSPMHAKHNQPFQVVGSDMSGVVLRVGPGVQRWRPGDRIVATPQVVGLELPDGHDDTMVDPSVRAWGFETNYGGLAEMAVLNATQLMPKPEHLSWEEAACSALCNSTAYRMLVARNGARMKQGDVVLIWGACGGLGSYATQLALNGGAIPVCVVSSAAKADLARAMGAELIIDRSECGYRFWKDEHSPDPREWKRFRTHVRQLTGGEDPDIVFEHSGRETFGVSVFTARNGGAVVTCASTTGYEHQFDNRYLWMHLKRIIGSHGANYRESWEANRLIAKGHIHPTLSAVYPMAETGRAAQDVHRNRHSGKVGVLCLAPQEGLGVRDRVMRERHLEAINRFRSTTT